MDRVLIRATVNLTIEVDESDDLRKILKKYSDDPKECVKYLLDNEFYPETELVTKTSLQCAECGELLHISEVDDALSYEYKLPCPHCEFTYGPDYYKDVIDDDVL